MDPPTDERELIRKLVDTCHLNVPERRGLPGGRAKASLILDAIEETLRTGGWFPSGVRPEDDYAGGLIELSPEGQCRIYWKSEFSFLRYELDAVGNFETPREAARTLARAVFGEQIDGITIDWDA
ncbi:MAG TPA: hypothetical protein VGP63_30240 [Planctomycetaceae bacterium]|jgi:hypothetical protein|nr:hypothetical protein [Planctomycetaceae bacterium]